MNVPSSALVVGAHPDDCEFGAGGTVFKWAQGACKVHFLVVTDGGQGSGDSAQERVDLVKRRHQEQRDSAKILGVEECHFLDLRDGEVANDLDLVKALVKVIRELKPEVVITHTTEALDHRPFHTSNGSWINHRDHRAVAQATLDAVYPYSRNPNSFQDLKLAIHKVSQVLLWGSRFATLEIEVEEGLDKKAEALAQHRSQFPQNTDWTTLKKIWGALEKFEVVELS